MVSFIESSENRVGRYLIFLNSLGKRNFIQRCGTMIILLKASKFYASRIISKINED